MNSNIKTSELRIVRWNEAEFAAASTQWSELLSEFSGDNVFLTWEWMFHWWQNRKNPESKLCIWAVLNGEQLVGIAPLYIEPDSYFKGLLKSNRLQFIGKRFNGHSGVRSEYQQFILHDRFAKPALELILKQIRSDQSWSEFYIGDFVVGEFQHDILLNCFKKNAYHKRVEGRGPTYVVSTQGNFQDYIASLGKNTRLKLFNRRKLLATLGNVELAESSREQLPGLIACMNQKHQVRWGKPAFSSTTVDFLERFMSEDNVGTSLATSSVLKVDDNVISVILNLEYKGVIYNIQLGFEQEFHPKISVGTLHLGYAIESAFSQNLSKFDLLEGSGKNDDYKKRISAAGSELATYRFVRSPLLKLVFKHYDRYLRT